MERYQKNRSCMKMTPLKTMLFWFLIVILQMQTGCAPAAPTNRLVIGGGPDGGVWLAISDPLSKMLGQAMPAEEISIHKSSGGIENLKLLTETKADLVFTYDYHVMRINQGNLPAAAQGKHPIRILMGLYEQPLQVVISEGSDITTLADLKGKRVSTGQAGGGVEEQAQYVLQSLGLDADKDIHRQKLGPVDSAAALKEGKLDAFFWSGAVPTAVISKLASEMQLALLPVSGSTADALMKTNPGVFHRTVIAAGAYPGLSQPVETLAVSAVLSVRPDMPDEQVKLILETVFAHTAELVPAWPGAASLTPAQSMQTPSSAALVYLHPAASAYFLTNAYSHSGDAARDEQVKGEVETAISMLQGIADMQTRGEITAEQARKMGAALLRGLSYGSDGYFWADTNEGVNVVLYGRPDVEGRNRLEDQDGHGNQYVKDFLSTGMDGGGYVDYWFTKKGQDTPLPKRSYVKLFEPFGWVVGSGYYR